MSYSFYLKTGDSPDFHDTIDSLSYDDLECDDIEFYPPLGEAFPEEIYFHFYRWGVSTRAVEIGFSNRALQVRIMTCSCAEDYQLAIDVVKYVAKAYDCEIEPEDRDPLALADFDTEFDGWVEQMVESGATFLPKMVRNPEYAGPLTLPGPRRDFHIGKRLIEELGDEDDPGFSERLFEKIRSVRYIDPDELYYHANVMQLENEETGDVTSLAVWGPGVDYLFPNVAYLSLIDDELIHIPIDAVKELTDVIYIDECQMLVDAIDDEEWADFLDRARQYAVSLGGDEEEPDVTNGVATNGSTAKKWWKFRK